jgi:hypothetical protein
MFLFRLLQRYERRAARHYRIPNDRVIEVEHRIDL